MNDLFNTLMQRQLGGQYGQRFHAGGGFGATGKGVLPGQSFDPAPQIAQRGDPSSPYLAGSGTGNFLAGTGSGNYLVGEGTYQQPGQFTPQIGSTGSPNPLTPQVGSTGSPAQFTPQIGSRGTPTANPFAPQGGSSGGNKNNYWGQ